MNRHPLQYHLQWRGQQRLQKKFRFTGILDVYVRYIQVCRSWEEIEIEKIKEIKVEESTILTKLFERILEEQNEGKKLILSQETAGTEDSFLVDLAVAANITLILVENRESAYYTVLNNRLLQLEEKIGG